MEAPGIEADQSPPSDPIEHQSSPIEVRAVSANVPDRAPKCAIDRRKVTESSEAYELSNVVETALAKALVLAAEAKRWDVVVRIAGELKSRHNRKHRAANRKSSERGPVLTPPAASESKGAPRCLIGNRVRKSRQHEATDGRNTSRNAGPVRPGLWRFSDEAHRLARYG